MSEVFNRGHFKNMFTEKDKHTTHSKTHRHFMPIIHKGEEFTITIEELAPNREGIAHSHGFDVMVPHTEVGETLKVKVLGTNKKVAHAYRLGEIDYKHMF